jgi:hypothetical protein
MMVSIAKIENKSSYENVRINWKNVFESNAMAFDKGKFCAIVNIGK